MAEIRDLDAFGKLLAEERASAHKFGYTHFLLEAQQMLTYCRELETENKRLQEELARMRLGEHYGKVAVAEKA